MRASALIRENLQSLHKLFKKTEFFLCETTTPAGNNWGQIVEVNEYHPTESKELWVRLLRSRHLSMGTSHEQMCFTLENNSYTELC